MANVKMKNKFLLMNILIFLFCIFSTKTVFAKTITVAQDGSGNYKTIQAAVNKSKSGDTIIVNPGIYQEPVKIVGKTLNIIGTDRDTCMVFYPTNNYTLVPLYIQAGNVSNMTFYGYGGIQGYTVHIDNAYQFKRNLTFNNCKIISNSAQDCLGIGTYGYSTIAFNDCFFETNFEFMFYHNAISQKYNGPSLIAFNNCNITNTGISHIRNINYNINNPVAITFNGSVINGVLQEN